MGDGVKRRRVRIMRGWGKKDEGLGVRRRGDWDKEEKELKGVRRRGGDKNDVGGKKEGGLEGVRRRGDWGKKKGGLDGVRRRRLE